MVKYRMLLLFFIISLIGCSVSNRVTIDILSDKTIK